MAKNPLTDNLLEPLNGAKTARINISAGDGNLLIDRLTGSEQMLASGTLQYVEGQGIPTRTLDSSNGQATLTVKGGINLRPRFRLPWSACNSETNWQIHLNPSVSSEITARSGGGNVKLDLDGMTVTRVSADTGGGNMDMILPENGESLSIDAKTGGGNVSVEIGSGLTGSSVVNAQSGAGNVAVHIPGGIAARIHATTGLGKAVIDPQFTRTGDNTYQSLNFDSADNKIEIKVSSGAGNVSVDTR